MYKVFQYNRPNIITQLDSWYSFYHPTEAEGWVNLDRLGVRNLPKILRSDGRESKH